MGELVRQWGAWLDASGWSAIIGLLGSLVGIAGVPFAVVKAWQASRAAEAARAAAEATTLRVNTLDAVRRLASTLTSLDEFYEQLGVEERQQSARLGRTMRRELIDLAEVGGLFPADDQAIMQAAVNVLLEVEGWLDAERTLGLDERSSVLRRQLAERLDEMHRVLARLKQRGWGS